MGLPSGRISVADLPRPRVTLAWEQVATCLRDFIETEDWLLDVQLPPETLLADHLGVSRGTLRRALRQLTSEGLIAARRGADSGTYVLGRGASVAR